MSYGASDGRKRFRVYFEHDEVRNGRLVRKPANKVVMADSEADAHSMVESRYANVDAFAKSAIEC